MEIWIPKGANLILSRLRQQGHESYVVGGCVRDTLLGRTPGDWDVCTAALPEETEACFSDCRVIETGVKHGTVTVLAEGEPVEVTTFRRDGEYRDHRRPEQVIFVGDLTEDLSRRDFTINAMAAGPDGEIIDPFGGREDLERRIIRCVGDPDRRFQEDALRMLRGLRFAAQLEFSIDPATANAMERNKNLLSSVSGERIYKELDGLLTGPGAGKVLAQYGAVLAAAIPEIGPSLGFLQRSPYHNRDVWGHTAEAVGCSGQDRLVRWALLLHDLGKPDTFTVDEQGVGHFYGHQAHSAELADAVFDRLHADRATREAVWELVRYHDAYAPPERKNVRRWLSRYGSEQLFRLLEVMRADTLAHVETEGSRRRYQGVMEFTALAREIAAETPALTVRDLAVDGRDILALGVPAGPRVGELLRELLEQVLEERIPNRRETLTAYLKKRLEDEP